MLRPVNSLEFATVRDALQVSDSVLSKHVKTLHDAGYVTVTKTPANARMRTWLALTSAGRHAFDGHLAELRRIANLATSPDGVRPGS